MYSDMKLPNILIFMISPILLTSCSDSTTPVDQRTALNDTVPIHQVSAQNDQRIWSVEDSVKGLWEVTDPVSPELYYLEVTDNMLIHYVYNENPWGLEGTCFETTFELLKRISADEYLREDLPRQTHFVTNESELKMIQTDVFDDDWNCIFDEITETTLTKIENISSQDLALCYVARDELGLLEYSTTSEYNPQLGDPYKPVVPTCN